MTRLDLNTLDGLELRLLEKVCVSFEVWQQFQYALHTLLSSWYVFAF